MSKAPDDTDGNKRLGRMTVFRGLAGDKAIEATSAEIEAEADADATPASDSDSAGRKPPQRQRENDSD